jgi:hypothetical protein
LDALCDELANLRVQALESEIAIARLEEQGKLRSAGLAGLSVILATIAGWLGMSR